MSLDQISAPISDPLGIRPVILIVDDSRVVRASLKNILQQAYTIIEADNGDKAWSLLHNDPTISLVFSDLSMPRPDGRELLRRLRRSSDPRLQNLPYIVVTGREEDQEFRAQLIDEGATDLVTKPFNSEDITDFANKHTFNPKPTVQRDALSTETFQTGISDKIDFSQNARKQLSYAIRNKNELALLLLQFDQFDTIQKHYSDPAIEHILITTAEIIQAYTRMEDSIGYFGDGLFAILLPATNSVATKHLGRKILSDLHAKRFYLGESDSIVTASIGISAPDIKPGTSFSDLLSIAEQRLQAAINAGGNKVVDKGNATITPISTLLSEESETATEKPKGLDQTELSMRKLVGQEALRRNGTIGAQGCNSDTRINELNDALLQAERENGQLTAEILTLRQNNEELKRLKMQLHEMDAMQQQTELRLSRLQSDYAQMRKRAEEAESNLTLYKESNSDHSIIEQHLLQESELIQQRLREANEQKERSNQAQIAAESRLAELQEELQSQKVVFELELADEHTMRSIAENKLADLEDKLKRITQEANHHTLTAIPTLNQLDKSSVFTHDAPTLRPKVQPIQEVMPTKVPLANKSNISSNKHVVKSKWSWPSKILLLTIVTLSGLLCLRVWEGLAAEKINTEYNKVEKDNSDGHAEQQGQRKTDLIRNIDDNENATARQHSPRPAQMPLKNLSLRQSQLIEEAKLQAELSLRQMAEEEFVLSSQTDSD